MKYIKILLLKVGSLKDNLARKKSRLQETKHLSTDADSSTDTIVWWTKNTQKPDFFEERTKTPKTQKLKNVEKYDKIIDTPFDQRSLIHQEAWFLGGPRIPKNPSFLKNGKNHPKRKTQKRLEICQKTFFLRGNFRPLLNKNVYI